jgi:hypothetical protein
LLSLGATSDRRDMRADMNPEEVRAAGVYLNGGRRRGWKRRLSGLLGTPEATISAWSTRSPGNARPIPGVATVAIKLLVAMMRQELMATAHPSQAGDALVGRVAALVGRPDQDVREPSITIEAPALGLPAVQPTPPPLGQPEPAPEQWRMRIEKPPDAPLPFGIKQGRAGRPGSSA